MPSSSSRPLPPTNVSCSVRSRLRTSPTRSSPFPKPPDMLAIEDTVVTVDAAGCRREIPQKIIDNNTEYVLALKGNQGTLQEVVFHTVLSCTRFRRAKLAA